MTDPQLDVSEAVEVYLKHYPGKNEDEFRARFGTDAAREAVRALLDEASSIRIVWADKSLIDIGEEVEMVMQQRHPELSAAALEKLSNYVTYLVR
jgi:hypothetical protein